MRPDAIHIVLRFGLSLGVWGIVSIRIIRFLDFKVFTLLNSYPSSYDLRAAKAFHGKFFIQRTGGNRRKQVLTITTDEMARTLES